MADNPHELSALYALDVLDADERARYEDHLAGCESCQSELRGLREAAVALAFATDAQAPPASLRERILEQARAEPQNVVPLRSRRSFAVAVASALAVVATAAAVALGVWAASLHHSLAHERAAVDVLGDPHARHVPLQGAAGQLVVAPSGEAALAVSLPAPPNGKTYETWVIDGGVHRDRLFKGGTVLLVRRLSAGTTVKVTLERAGGVDAPTSTPLLSAHV
jgi:anti-sigma factor RsiW